MCSTIEYSYLLVRNNPQKCKEFASLYKEDVDIVETYIKNSARIVYITYNDIYKNNDNTRVCPRIERLLVEKCRRYLVDNFEKTLTPQIIYGEISKLSHQELFTMLNDSMDDNFLKNKFPSCSSYVNFRYLQVRNIDEKVKKLYSKYKVYNKKMASIEKYIATLPMF